MYLLCLYCFLRVFVVVFCDCVVVKKSVFWNFFYFFIFYFFYFLYFVEFVLCDEMKMRWGWKNLWGVFWKVLCWELCVEMKSDEIVVRRENLSWGENLSVVKSVCVEKSLVVRVVWWEELCGGEKISVEKSELAGELVRNSELGWKSVWGVGKIWRGVGKIWLGCGKNNLPSRLGYLLRTLERRKIVRLLGRTIRKSQKWSFLTPMKIGWKSGKSRGGQNRGFCDFFWILLKKCWKWIPIDIYMLYIIWFLLWK